MISYRRAELADTVIVRCYAAAAEVYSAAYITVADLGKMSRGGVLADLGVLYLDKVSDLYTAVEYRAWP